MGMKRILVMMVVAAGQSVLAADKKPYSELVRTDTPVVYWNFTNPKNLGETELSLSQESTPAPLRGLEGLAGTFSRSAIRGHAVARLDDQQNKKITALLNNSFTLELWFLDEAPKADGSFNYSIFYKADAQGFTRNSVWLYRKRQNGNLMFTLQDTGDELIRIEIENPVLLQMQNSRTFHHLAITVERFPEKNSSKVTAFLDGKQVKQATFKSSPTFNNSGNLFFGNNHQLNSPWEGRLDEFAIYNKILKPERIQKHYESGKKYLTPLVKGLTTHQHADLVTKEASAKVIEAAIRKKLKKPAGELTKADLEKVTGLSLYNNQLTDVKGLEKLTQLTSLDLNYNQLTDVKRLENLTKLRGLSLDNNQLTDVKGLEKLTKLTFLNLRYNPLTKAQITELQKALPKCKIYSNPTK